jgi:hypothetical protein
LNLKTIFNGYFGPGELEYSLQDPWARWDFYFATAKGKDPIRMKELEMNRKNMMPFSLTLCLVGIIATQAAAFNGYGSSFRSIYPDICQELLDATFNTQGCILCHFVNSKNPQNPYGQAYANGGYDFAAIESLDSDGDGRTNGEEINIDCTFPGDAASPVNVDSWGGIKALFR